MAGGALPEAEENAGYAGALGGMNPAFTHIRTTDGTVLARDPLTGAVASGRSLEEAFAELRRLSAQRAAA